MGGNTMGLAEYRGIAVYMNNEGELGTFTAGDVADPKAYRVISQVGMIL